MRLPAPVFAALAFAAGAALGAAEVDPETGLALDENFEVVKMNCTVCHSAKLVTQMRATREAWKSLIVWMQETQNLWRFPPATEAAILDYLAQHYAPERAAFRRKPLDPALLPPAR